jgi:8-oxo-dGTP pyrophosphatase MutT (NUDIX family)
LILKKGDKFLFSLRKNTGYCDGYWSLVAGHAEDTGETATEAIIREAKEEANMILDKNDIKVAHVMQRDSGRDNIDIFFVCDNYTGEIVNMEPEKCGGLEFFSLEDLPACTLEYIKFAIFKIRDGIFYSEITQRP